MSNELPPGDGPPPSGSGVPSSPNVRFLMYVRRFGSLERAIVSSSFVRAFDGFELPAAALESPFGLGGGTRSMPRVSSARDRSWYGPSTTGRKGSPTDAMRSQIVRIVKSLAPMTPSSTP